MYVSVHAVDDSKWPEKPRGKKSAVHSDKVSVEWDGRYLRLSASGWEQRGTGARGGTPKETQRTAKVVLDHKDLQRILDAALSAGLIELSCKVRKPEKRQP